MLTPNELHELLLEAAGGEAGGVPMHLVHRVLVLLPDENVIYVDADLHETDDLGRSGGIVVVSLSRLVLATLNDAKTPDRFNPGATSSVDVSVWSRSELVSASITAGSDPGHNADSAWQQEPNEQWPGRGRVTLHYRDREPLTLPLKDLESAKQATAFKAVVGSLLADMGEAVVMT